MKNKNKPKFRNKNGNKKPKIVLNNLEKLIKQKIVDPQKVNKFKIKSKKQNKKRKFGGFLTNEEKLIKENIFNPQKGNNLEKQNKKQKFRISLNDLEKNIKKKIVGPKFYKKGFRKQNLNQKINIKKQTSEKFNENKTNLKSSDFRISRNDIKAFSEKVIRIKQEIRKIVIGQEKVIDGLIRAFICNGHVILEGVPGIAKTLLIKSLGRVSGCEVKRIQFTVDLLPTDIIGLTIYRNKVGFEVIKGPIFANFVIADEINRSPPKSQSALLEAMQERQVTIGRKTFVLPRPFFVMATRNPLESSGVYALPEAQVDRFIFKLMITYPKIEEEKLVMKRNVESKSFEEYNLQQIISPAEIIKMQSLVKQIYLSSRLENYIVNIVDYTRNKKNKYVKYIDWGASPRASIAFFIASKAEALMNGRAFVVPEDIKKIAPDILRHRLILGYEAEANNITSDYIIEQILNEIQI